MQHQHQFWNLVDHFGLQNSLRITILSTKLVGTCRIFSSSPVTIVSDVVVIRTTFSIAERKVTRVIVPKPATLACWGILKKHGNKGTLKDFCFLKSKQQYNFYLVNVLEVEGVMENVLESVTKVEKCPCTEIRFEISLEDLNRIEIRFFLEQLSLLPLSSLI